MKRNWKKSNKRKNKKGFLAKLLIAALLVTSIPLQTQNRITVKAAIEPSMPTDADSIVSVASVDAFYAALEDYATNTETVYPNGILIELLANLDFSTYTGTGETAVPAGNVWINLAGYSMTAAPKTLMELGDGTNSYFLKIYNDATTDSSIIWSGADSSVVDYNIYTNATLVVSNVTTDNTRYAIASGAEYSDGMTSYLNPTDSVYMLYHNAAEATYRVYEGVGDSATCMLHYEEIYEAFLTGKTWNVNDLIPTNVSTDSSIGRYVYEADALPSSIISINYDDLEYTKPSVDFIVDSDYGVYSLSEDGTTMTFYAANIGNVLSYYVEALTEEDSTTVICANLFNNFTPYIVNESAGKTDGVISTTTVQATNVIFTNASIPTTGTYGSSTYDIGKIRIYGSNEGQYVSREIQFDFQLDTTRNLPIYNLSSAAVNATEGNKVWVRFPFASDLAYAITVADDGNVSVDDCVTIDYTNAETITFDTRYYVAAGGTVRLTPIENYTIYDIQVGGYYELETTGYDYSNGRRLDSSQIKHYTDGTKEITIPNFECYFTATVGEMATIEAANPANATDAAYEFSADAIYNEVNTESSTEYIDWRNEDFTISPVNNSEVGSETSEITKYELVESNSIVTGEIWNGTNSISVTGDGLKLTKTYKLINKSVKETADTFDEDFDGDTSEIITIPGDSYGMEFWVTYTYTLDTTNPVITDVTAISTVNKDGAYADTSMSLNGGWQISGDTVTAQTVWTTAEKVTLNVTAVDGDAGTGVSGYKFEVEGAAEDTWNTTGSMEYTEEGLYNLEIYARDQMQEYAMESQEVTIEDKWITSFGIDRTAPEVGYSDAVSIAVGGDNVLESNKTYKGSLVIEVFDEGSGFDSITVYESNDAGEWVENRDALVMVSAETGADYASFYISGEEEDKTYRIDITDVAGNEVSYTGITVSDSSIEVGTADEFLQHLTAYQQMRYAGLTQDGVPNLYPTGLSLSLTTDIDFANRTVDAPEYFPSGMVWIETNGYNLTNMPEGLFDMTADNLPEEMKEGATFYLEINGGGKIGWQANDLGISDVLIGENATFQIVATPESFADITGNRFIVEAGGNLGLSDIDVLNPIDSGYVRYYDSKEGIYQIAFTDDGTAESIYFETLNPNLFVDENASWVPFDVYHIPKTVQNDGISEFSYYRYAPSVIPEKDDLVYEGATYANPGSGVELIADRTRGLYSTYMNKATIYAVATEDTDSGCSYGVETVSDESTEEVAYLTINGQWLNDFYASFSKIIFDENAILSEYTKDDGTTVEVGRVYLESETNEENSSDMELEFIVNSDSEIVFYSCLASPVNFVDAFTGYEASTELWVTWLASGESDSELVIEHATVENAMTVVRSGYCYIKAGSWFMITPEEGYTICDIDFGNWIADSTPGHYYYMQNSQDNIIFYATGVRGIKIPNYAIAFSALATEMEVRTIENTGEAGYEYEFTGSLFESEDDSVDYYRERFWIDSIVDEEFDEETGVKRFYHILPVDSNGVRGNSWGYSVKCQDEGLGLTQEVIILDLSLQKTSVDTDGDGVTDREVIEPVDTYGMETKLIYQYALDIDSPSISNVVVVDGENNELSITGAWQEDSAEVIETEEIWTNRGPVIVTVTASDGEAGTGLAGYLFANAGDETSVWQESNTAVFAADGYYNLSIKARDGFDALTGHIPAKSYITGFGIDTIAPEIYYTDSVTTSLELMSSDMTFQGNLYIEGADTGSGVSKVEAYEFADGAWVLYKLGLGEVYDDTNTLTGYYLAATDADKNYRLEVTDIAGNLNVYDNITISGYTQDIEMELGDTVTVYGQGASVPITVTNTSECDLQINEFALRTEASHESLTLSTAETTTLKAGEIMTATLTLPSTVRAGEYTAILDINYVTVGTNVSTSVAKAYSEVITVTVEKAAGSATLALEHIYYGETMTPIVASETNGIKDVVIYYKEESESDEAYTTIMPTEVGSYIVTAVFPATDNYDVVELVSGFTISRLEADENMYFIDTEQTEAGWYAGDIIISAPEGYQLCRTEDGTYEDTLVIGESTESYGFYIKTDTGAITTQVVLTDILIDKTAPETDEEEGIYVSKTWWQTFLETITFGLYQTKTETVQIVAHDDESGMANISYYVSDVAMTYDEITAVKDWVEGTEFTIEANEERSYVVYARLENNAGLINYISTDGIVIKLEHILEAGKTYLEAGVACKLGEGTWRVSGDDTIYTGGCVFYVSESKEYDFVKVN